MNGKNLERDTLESLVRLAEETVSMVDSKLSAGTKLSRAEFDFLCSALRAIGSSDSDASW